MNKDLIQNNPDVEENKSSIKTNDFALKDKKFTDSDILDKSKVETGLDFDISKIKPKKYQKNIQKMCTIIQDHLQYNDIKDEITDLSNKKKQLEDDNKKLIFKNEEIENKTQEFNSQYENLKINLDKAEKNQNILNIEIANLKEKEKNLNTKIEELDQNRTIIEKETAIEKNNKENYEKKQRDLKLEINQLLENKTFYSETLSGHKKETNKILLANIGFCFFLLSVMAGVLYFAYTFYQDGIKHISQENSYIKMTMLFSARAGIGVLLYYIFRLLSTNLKYIITEIYTIFKGIREIESSLILAREITFSTEKDIEFKNDEEKRSYLSFLKISVLKNYFINLNSLKKSLHIKDDKQKLIEN